MEGEEKVGASGEDGGVCVFWTSESLSEASRSSKLSLRPSIKTASRSEEERLKSLVSTYASIPREEEMAV